MGWGGFFVFDVVEETTTGGAFNISDFEKDLNKLQREVFPQALSRTVNDVGAKAKTAAMKELVSSMNVKKKHINKKRYFTIDKSNLKRNDFTYSWSGRSHPLPLSYFKGRRLKHRSQKGKFGYSAAVLGEKKKYKFFGATMKSGHEGAFYRKSGSKHGKSNTGKRGEYPIKQAYGASIPRAMIEKAVERAWNNLTKQTVFASKLSKNIDFYSSRLLKKRGR